MSYHDKSIETKKSQIRLLRITIMGHGLKAKGSQYAMTGLSLDLKKPRTYVSWIPTLNTQD